GAANPAYSLAINAPGGDRFESNDSASAATNLNGSQGNLQGPHTWGGNPDPPLSIGAGDVDWFRFTTVRTGRVGDLVRIDFAHAMGDLDLALYNSPTAAAPLLRSNGVSDGELVSLEGLGAGTYYIKVYGYPNDAVNPGYSLTIDAPENPTADW